MVIILPTAFRNRNSINKRLISYKHFPQVLSNFLVFLWCRVNIKHEYNKRFKDGKDINVLRKLKIKHGIILQIVLGDLAFISAIDGVFYVKFAPIT
jgi:hypothetical protein